MPMPTESCFSLIPRAGIFGPLKSPPKCTYVADERKGFEEKSMADDMEVKREIILEADAETIERMRKEGHARGFTVYCDEAERIGGDNSAPPPLAYFGLAVGF
jgi:hypothetical protein